jgi:hypothetical protein
LVKSEKSGTNRISIDPSAVQISPSGSGASEENTFKGKLIQLTDEQDRVRALVDVGMPLSVLIPKEVFRRQPLGMGEEVRVTCPIESIEVF